MSNPNKKINLAEHAVVLIVVCIIGLIANHTYQFTSNHAELSFFARLVQSPLSLFSGIGDAAIGMAILYVLCMLGLCIAKYTPFYLPSIAWISFLAILASSPVFPFDDFVLQYTGLIAGLPLTTAILAYAGFAIANREIEIFKTSGLKIIIVSLLIFVGTYLGSALVASFTLSLTGA